MMNSAGVSYAVCLASSQTKAGGRWSPHAIARMTDLEIAGLVWMLQMEKFAHDIKRCGERAASLDCALFIENPRDVLRALWRFFEMPGQVEDSDAFRDEGFFNRHLTYPDENFTLALRRDAMDGLSPRLREQIEKIAKSSIALLPRGALPLPNPLMTVENYAAMKLASLKQGRDGALAVVSRDLKRCVAAGHIAPTLQHALDHWHEAAPLLARVSDLLNEGSVAGETAFDPRACASPLPRAYQWADGSAYVTHVELVRKARHAEMPPSFWTDPLMYQGGSDSFIGPCDPIVAADEAWGIDFEGEVAVITDDVPYGCPKDDAESHIKLVMLVNDVSLRNLIPAELAKNFGFFQSKPASAFSPVAVTPDELGEAWSGAKLHLPLRASPITAPSSDVRMRAST